LIDTIAMIGSPAGRGAVASVVCARRGCLAAASAVSTVSAAIAASIVPTAGSRRRIATTIVPDQSASSHQFNVASNDYGIVLLITCHRNHCRVESDVGCVRTSPLDL